jgi:serine/threonine protein kinase
MTLATGTLLGPYEITAPLGAGGMGEVYRARDTRLERTVAIKILPAHLSSEPVRRQRFEREAKTVSSLNHPHICVLYDVGHQDGTDYLVMECLEGETLSKRLAKGPLPLEQVLKYGAQIADALDKAHRAGIVHRDLKPGNIMLTATGAKLLDFGLAKPAVPLVSGATLTAAVTQTTPVTQGGTIVGTFQYMSPEQVRGDRLDARTDLFSFGVVLYEMATGRQAFSGTTSGVIFDAILNRAPTAAGRVNPDLPPELDRIINKALEKDYKLRYQSASDLRADLQRLKRDTDSARTAAVSGAAHVAQPLPWWQRKAAVATGATVMAVLLVLATWLTFFRTRAEAIDSVAVLPFANATGDPNTEYLSDGISSCA